MWHTDRWALPSRRPLLLPASLLLLLLLLKARDPAAAKAETFPHPRAQTTLLPSFPPEPAAQPKSHGSLLLTVAVLGRRSRRWRVPPGHRGTPRHARRSGRHAPPPGSRIRVRRWRERGLLRWREQHAAVLHRRGPGAAPVPDHGARHVRLLHRLRHRAARLRQALPLPRRRRLRLIAPMLLLLLLLLPQIRSDIQMVFVCNSNKQRWDASFRCELDLPNMGFHVRQIREEASLASTLITSSLGSAVPNSFTSSIMGAISVKLYLVADN